MSETPRFSFKPMPIEPMHETLARRNGLPLKDQLEFTRTASAIIKLNTYYRNNCLSGNVNSAWLFCDEIASSYWTLSLMLRDAGMMKNAQDMMNVSAACYVAGLNLYDAAEVLNELAATHQDGGELYLAAATRVRIANMIITTPDPWPAGFEYSKLIELLPLLEVKDKDALIDSIIEHISIARISEIDGVVGLLRMDHRERLNELIELFSSMRS